MADEHDDGQCFEDYCCGTSYVGKVNIDVPCKECKGRGHIVLLTSTKECEKCKGTGRIIE